MRKGRPKLALIMTAEERQRLESLAHLDSPAHAAVSCVDEKPQVQALDRTQPSLPPQPGQVDRRTHDYQRHGTTTLFAPLTAKTSEVIPQCHQRHRSAQFRECLDLIDARVPKRLDVHIIMDNYSTHKTALIRNWFAKRQRFHVHVTPTYGSGSASSNAGWTKSADAILACIARFA